ncbi:hypothetical protein BOX15_Mlig008829g4 [Macrostomum lignano]|uniref:SAM domain-containing protein n=1 Tax=Macrostomum lignano TaxID=282301 RepID=A0A267GGI0_9PLAT|nr:hypothetical protein BOX15_Mlig008829g4 [Macrostomum lignano]
MCDALPSIPEDGASGRGGGDSWHLDGGGSSYFGGVDDNGGYDGGGAAAAEQLMVSLLDERDRLVESLRESQDRLAEEKRSAETARMDRNRMMKHLEAGVPKDSVSLVKEVTQLREQLQERDDEVAELKAERSNTRLLLEHLETLVARHERSLRMTVVKRQAASPSGVSSEVEVLKALKSLFEHHKALDEKVKEKLRQALDRATRAETELAAANEDLARLRSLSSASDDGTGAVANRRQPQDQQQQQTAASTVAAAAAGAAAAASAESARRLRDAEEALQVAQGEAARAVQRAERLQREATESEAARREAEARAADQEQRCLTARRDAETAQERCDRLEEQAAARDSALRSAEARLRLAREQTEEDGAAELIEARAELAKARAELARFRERERLHEEHEGRLSATVDQLLTESNARLQQHLEERMSALDERGRIVSDLEAARRELELAEAERERLAAENARLAAEAQQLREAAAEAEAAATAAAEEAADLADRLASEQEERRVLQTVQQAFDPVHPPAPPGSSRPTPPPPPPPPPAPQHSEAQSLALVIQQQLDAINNEIRLIQEEKDTAEQRAEELQSRVGSSTNVVAAPSSWQQQHHQQRYQQHHQMPSSPPTSGRSTPAGYSGRSASTVPQHLQQQQLAESPPTTPRSVRLERVARALAKAHESPEIALGSSPHSSPISGGSRDSLNASGYNNNTNTISNNGNGNNGNSNNAYHSSSNSSGSPQQQLAAAYGSSGVGGVGKKKSRLGGTLGRIFRRPDSPQPPRSRTLDGSSRYDARYPTDDSMTSSGHSFFGGDQERQRRKKEELLEQVMQDRSSFTQWSGPTVVAWLELWVGMPDWYVAACRANVKSGAIMASLSDQDIQRELGISNPLHRLKLRLAVQEMLDWTAGQGSSGNPSLVCGRMGHDWVGNSWLPSLGLGQYRSAFMDCLVDARMLPSLGKKELRSYLRMSDSGHRRSLVCGIRALHLLGFDRQTLEARREACAKVDSDLLVWSNDRLQQWLRGLGLLRDDAEANRSFRESGYHGALLVLESASRASLGQTLQQLSGGSSLVGSRGRALLDQRLSQLITEAEAAVEARRLSSPDSG